MHAVCCSLCQEKPKVSPRIISWANGYPQSAIIPSSKSVCPRFEPKGRRLPNHWPPDYYPSGVTAFGIASTLICATWTDYARVRWPVLLYMSFCCTAAAVCILIWASPTAVKSLAYYLAGASYSGQATTFAWANQICADDNQERAVVLASMTCGTM